jgi:hypothetical protein
MANLYNDVRALKPGRSAFNLSYDKKLTCDFGQLIPILCEEVVPGDKFKIGVEAVVRMMPMIAPILHEVNVYFHYFFVPTRLIWTAWETFITGGVLGTDATALPTWIPTHGDVVNQDGTTVKDNGVHSLWDYMGFPVTDAGIEPAGAYPLSFPRRAYNLVYNEYFRDETQVTAIVEDSSIVLQRAWEKDYFTSALPWQQRGTAPALPISGTSAAIWPANFNAAAAAGTALTWPAVDTTGGSVAPIMSVTYPNKPYNATAKASLEGGTVAAHNAVVLKTSLDNNTVNLGAATTFNVADLRLAFQIQKWMERNARGGARYTEFLKNHYGVSPNDARLNRPEYIGGTKMPLIVSEVLQTSESGTTPQGTMAGHGLSAGRDFCASYYAEEFGIIIGLMSIMPRSAYHQGINRQWLKTTRYDYYSPEWAHLSEQAITRAELYASDVLAENQTIFGYQGRYNEMRSKQAMTCGLMHYGVTGSLKQWHIARQFASAPALNAAFIHCIPRKDYLAVPAQPTCLVNIANVVTAIRPLPIEADPGLIDHS